MLINLRNREGKLIVKDILDIDFDMSVEEENNKYVININHQFKLDGEFESEEAAEEWMIHIADSRNKIEAELSQY